MMKELVIFDMDGTIVNGQSQMIFLRYLLSKHEIKLSFYIRLSVWFVLYKIGFVNDPKRPMEYAFSFLKGESVEMIAAIAHSFFEEKLKKSIFLEASNIILEHQRIGREVILVSNAAELIVKEIALYLSIDRYISTTLEIKDGYYTGKITDILYGERKTEILKRFAGANHWNIDTAWAYGDHSSDQSLLSIVKHPVAVNPSPDLSKVASKRHWPILSFKETLK